VKLQGGHCTYSDLEFLLSNSDLFSFKKHFNLFAKMLFIYSSTLVYLLASSMIAFFVFIHLRQHLNNYSQSLTKKLSGINAESNSSMTNLYSTNLIMLKLIPVDENNASHLTADLVSNSENSPDSIFMSSDKNESTTCFSSINQDMKTILYNFICRVFKQTYLSKRFKNRNIFIEDKLINLDFNSPVKDFLIF
jgi:hypothetical protein